MKVGRDHLKSIFASDIDFPLNSDGDHESSPCSISILRPAPSHISSAYPNKSVLIFFSVSLDPWAPDIEKEGGQTQKEGRNIFVPTFPFCPRSRVKERERWEEGRERERERERERKSSLP